MRRRRGDRTNTRETPTPRGDPRRIPARHRHLAVTRDTVARAEGRFHVRKHGSTCRGTVAHGEARLRVPSWFGARMERHAGMERSHVTSKTSRTSRHKTIHKTCKHSLTTPSSGPTPPPIGRPMHVPRHACMCRTTLLHAEACARGREDKRTSVALSSTSGTLLPMLRKRTSR